MKKIIIFQKVVKKKLRQMNLSLKIFFFTETGKVFQMEGDPLDMMTDMKFNRKNLWRFWNIQPFLGSK